MSPTVRALRVGPAPAIGWVGLPSPVASALAGRGVLLERLPGEAAVAFGERLDTALMALFRDTGDPQAFEALYTRVRGALLDWLRRLLAQQRCGLDPLDVLQDTFVNMYRYGARFRDERSDSFRVWARTIAANALRRAKSTGRRAVVVRALDDVAEPVAPRGQALHLACEAEDRRELAQTWLCLLAVYSDAFSRLSPRDRRALELVEVEGLSYAEAGARLAVGPSNMKMIMFRARQRLHERMAASLSAGASVVALRQAV